ncbi:MULTISPECIES: effector-associated constant component EACC1 [Streptomyces griseus group]|uniref:effector-associated constant component EACC1 n=1 Tax=Streptomyces griseus group TaxID=629295 RepID=UPI002E1255AF|nr:hypothetical protein OG366_00140 [Streptomyces cyaneofuscatus]WSI52720.1 hypothetical protein OG366_37020 [Streptomyces cyaneofuscatus]
MEIVIRLDEPKQAEEELRSLYTWLLSEPELRRHARLSLASSRAPEPGAQGDMIDVLSLVLGTSLNTGALALSIATWRSTRPRQITVTLERSDGRSVTVTATSPQEAQRAVESLLDNDSGDASGATS